MEWMLMPLKRYADFSGRSRRMEFWMFQLLNVIVTMVLIFVTFGGMPWGAMTDPTAMTDTSMVAAEPGALFYVGAGLLVVWALGVLIPSIAVTVRRFHDRDMSGWWYLGFIVASIIPLVGFVATIALIVLMALPGTAGPNRFGPDPLGQADPEVFA
jgi:uncharacterized membrane protein YhaH (DUF805 family)